MRLLQKHYHGFTLIELLVTTAIAAVVVGGGIAGFIGFTERQEVQNTAKEVQQMMRTAQSKARVRDVPTGCAKLDSYEVIIASDKATLNAICTPAAPSPTIKTYTYPKTLSVSSNPSPNPLTLRFATLEQGVFTSDNNKLANTTTFVFADISGTPSFSFSVSPIGKISTVQ